MRNVLAVVTLWCGGTVLAQAPQPQPQPQPQPAPAPPAAASSESIKAAETLLDEVARAYKQAKAFTDNVQLEFQSPNGKDKQDMKMSIGSGNDAFLSFSGLSFTAVGDKLYITKDETGGKYMTSALQGDLVKSVETIFGQGALRFAIPLALRWTDPSAPDRLKLLSLGMLGNPAVADHQMIKTEQGESMDQVSLAGDQGSALVQIHPQTKLIHQIRLNGQQGNDFVFTLNMSPKVYDALPTPIAFDAGAAREVKSVAELMTIQVGDVPPDFSLPTLEGETVSLSSLKGSMVVIDFWATWCGPCKKGLPLLQEFATWAKESGKPIKVYPIDVMERVSSPDEAKTKVKDFWTGQKYTMVTLLDLQNNVYPKYGFSGIPATVVVGPDGKVIDVHNGYMENMVELLKKNVEDALK